MRQPPSRVHMKVLPAPHPGAPDATSRNLLAFKLAGMQDGFGRPHLEKDLSPKRRYAALDRLSRMRTPQPLHQETS